MSFPRSPFATIRPIGPQPTTIAWRSSFAAASAGMEPPRARRARNGIRERMWITGSPSLIVNGVRSMVATETATVMS